MRDAIRERLMRWQEERGFTFWVVERKADGELLGFCGLKIADTAGQPDRGRCTRSAGGCARMPGGRAMPRKRRSPRSISPSRRSARRASSRITFDGNEPSWGLMERLGMTRRPELDYDDPRFPDAQSDDRLRHRAGGAAAMNLIPFDGKAPRIDPAAFVAPGAQLIGDVEIGPEASVWYNCVLRGDMNLIRIGARTNVQDGTVIHVDPPRPGGRRGLSAA